MEMEHINDNLIKVMINTNDLEERGINFLDLIGDQSSIEQFFYSILEEVDVDQHFQESEAVTFQVMPNKDGLELYISKNNFDELENVWENEVTKRIEEYKQQRIRNKERLEAREEFKAEKKKAEDKGERTSDDRKFKADLDSVFFDMIRFSNIELAIEASKIIEDTKYEQSLYYFNDEYFMVFMEGVFLNPLYPSDELWPILEYGNTTLLGAHYVQEHGKLVIDKNAIQTLNDL